MYKGGRKDQGREIDRPQDRCQDGDQRGNRPSATRRQRDTAQHRRATSGQVGTSPSTATGTLSITAQDDRTQPRPVPHVSTLRQDDPATCRANRRSGPPQTSTPRTAERAGASSSWFASTPRPAVPGPPAEGSMAGPLRTASAPSRRRTATSFPKARGLSPVNGAIQDGSDAVFTPATRSHLLWPGNSA